MNTDVNVDVPTDCFPLYLGEAQFALRTLAELGGTICRHSEEGETAFSAVEVLGKLGECSCGSSEPRKCTCDSGIYMNWDGYHYIHMMATEPVD